MTDDSRNSYCNDSNDDSDALESAVAGAPLGPVRLTASFLANRERVSLPFSMGGLAIRRWSPHAHAAYVAHWRQVLTSTQFSLAGIDADFCAFPAVTGVIEVAAGAALLAMPGPLRGSRLQGQQTLFGRDRSLRAALVALQLRYASPTS